MNTISIDSSSLTENSNQYLKSQKYGPNWIYVDRPEDEGGNYQLELEMPGIDKKDAKFIIQEFILTVEGKTEEYKYHQKWALPKGTDASKCVVSMKNGIAKVTLPKLEPQKPIQIHVQ